MKLRSVFLLVVVVIVIISGGVFMALNVMKKNRATVQDESSTERSESMRAAFVDTEYEASKEDHAEFVTVTQVSFAKLAKGIENKDDKAIGSVVSAKAMLDYAERADLLKVPALKRKDMVDGMEKGLARGFKNAAGLMDYKEVKVLRIEPIKKNEFIAYTFMWNSDLEVNHRMRWWFLKGGQGKWVIYDYEDFDTNLRGSTMMGVSLRSLLKGKSGWTGNMLDLVRAVNGADADNLLDKLIEAESSALALMKHKDTPHNVQGFARVILVSSYLAQEKIEDALSEVEILLAKHPDVYVAHYSKGVALTSQEKWNEAIASFNKYGELLGWDSDVHEMIADAYLGKGDLEKAHEHAAKGISHNANAYGCLVSYALSLPEGNRDRLLAVINQTKEPELAYEYVMDSLIEDGGEVLAQWLLGELKKAMPDSELIEYYEDEFSESNGREAGAEKGQ